MTDVMQPFVVRPVQDRLVDYLREKIQKAEAGYEPGQRLITKVIAAELGVSPTPIIQALQKLSGEGLVIYRPRNGSYVTELSEQEIADVADLRCGLEILALTIQRKKPLAEAVAELRAQLDRGRDRIAAEDLAAYTRCDYDFHLLLVSASRNEVLVTVYRGLCGRAQLGRAYAPQTLAEITSSFEQHLALVPEIASGNLVRIQSALTQHWEWSKQRMLQVHRHYQERRAAAGPTNREER